jgi:Tol biopolymer transport system component
VRGQTGQTVWQMDMSGSNLKEITKGPSEQIAICSPDGPWLAYQTLNDKGNIWRTAIDGGDPTRLTTKAGGLLDVSADGKLVAFLTTEGTVPNFRSLWLVIPSTGGDPVYSLTADVRATRRFRFTPDGKALSYVVNERGVSNIWAMPLAGGAPTQLTDFKSDQIFDFAWSRDGKQLALSRGQVSSDVVLLTDTSK